MAEPDAEYTGKLTKVIFWLTTGSCIAFCLVVILFIF